MSGGAIPEHPAQPPRRRRTDVPELRPWLETYPRGQLTVLLVAPLGVWAADSPNLLLVLAVLSALGAVLIVGWRET